MRLQQPPVRGTCLPTSFAMAMDVSVIDVLNALGHDGSEIVWPNLPEPTCRRGFHIQELIRLAMQWGWSVTPVELAPVLGCADGRSFQVYPDDECWAFFEQVIRTSQGVIEGHGLRCRHAVAYDNGRIFDPDSGGYDYSREACQSRCFYPTHLWRFTRG